MPERIEFTEELKEELLKKLKYLKPAALKKLQINYTTWKNYILYGKKPAKISFYKKLAQLFPDVVKKYQKTR